MRALLALAGLAGLAACGSGDAAPVCSATGTALFGRPNAMTGLDDSQCGPRCTCHGADWEAPLYTAADADQLLTWQLAEPIAPLTSNPYDAPAPPPAGADAVCAIVTEAPGARTYRLQSFDSEAAARAAGAQPTHFGACGTCSTLADLAVYMRYPDLTEPVRQCGLDHLNGPEAEHIQCLQDLGFTYPCAQIWYYNTIHTRDACTRPCFLAVGEPYNVADGGLNECLRCDEDESGAVFKAVAGRTRRNTGIASAMCRPCSEVRPLLHEYR
jgi:hypothetical protein